MRIVTVECGGVAELGLLGTDGLVLVPPNEGRMPIEQLPDDSNGIERLRELNGAPERCEKPDWGRCRFLAPIPRPHDIVCVGKNYVDHAAEEGALVPAEPLLFMKHYGSVTGPDSDITWSTFLAQVVDWKAELAVGIGARAEACRQRTRSTMSLDIHASMTCLRVTFNWATGSGCAASRSRRSALLAWTWSRSTRFLIRRTSKFAAW
jgi:hypothetical protein